MEVDISTEESGEDFESAAEEEDETQPQQETIIAITSTDCNVLITEFGEL